MHLRKLPNLIELISNGHKCNNWCLTSLSRRYFSGNDDKNNDNESETHEEIDPKKDSVEQKELTIAKEKSDKVLNARQKLNELLNQMKVDTSLVGSESLISKVMAKPKYHIRKSARDEKPINELEKIDNISRGIDQRLVIAAKAIASTLSGSAAEQTKAELLQLLKSHFQETIDAKNGKFVKTNELASIFSGMKIEKEKQKQLYRDSRSDSRRDSSTVPRMAPRDVRQRSKDTFRLYNSEPLGIFDADMKVRTDGQESYLWGRLMDDELHYVTAQPPSNAFEELIKLTEEGKLWKYPINNEQGLEDEQNVPFYEHVLLDQLLEDFPERGPVRQFMELVIMGLSSNPYITVERKHATVDYYKQFFKEKEDILRSSGALG